MEEEELGLWEVGAQNKGMRVEMRGGPDLTLHRVL